MSLRKRGITFHHQNKIAVGYEEVTLDLGFRADVIVDDKLLLDLKSSESVTGVHQKILLIYLRLTNIKLGLLINFKEELVKNGIKRVVNNL